MWHYASKKGLWQFCVWWSQVCVTVFQNGDKERRKFNTFFNTITTKVKRRNRRPKQFVLFMDLIQYRMQRRGSQRFRSRNMDIKDETRSGRPIVETVDNIMEFVESNRHVSTYSIAQKLKISLKTAWNHLHKAGLKKKLDIWVLHEFDAKEPFGPNWCLRFFAETKRNRPSFEAHDDWQWKMGHIQEQQPKKIVVQSRWAGPNDRQARINGFAVCLVGLERNHPLWAAPIGLNTQFGPLLSTTDQIEAGDRREAARISQ